MNRDSEYSITHSLQRFEERYCRTLSIAEYKDLVLQVRELIQQNRNITSRKVLSPTNTQYVVELEFAGIDVISTYETERNTITTFLPNKDNKVTIVTTGTDNDSSTINVLYDLSKKPYVSHVYGLPDLTFNTPVPVGSSIEVYKHTYAKWIGDDVGCGVVLFLLRESRDSISHKDIANKLLTKYLDTDVTNEKRIGIEKYGITMSDFDTSLASIGGGNHFAELMIVEDGSLDLSRLYLCVHSGSRDFGVYVQSLFKDYDCIHRDAPEFTKFMNWHDQCVEWAKLNRELIAIKFCKAAGLTIEKRLYELTHNFIERNGDIFIHRKGSIPSKNGPAMIPGSRGIFSYLVQNRGSLHSLPHGSGRLLSRKAAKESLGHLSIKEMTTTNMDSYVVTNSKAILVTEHPDCYKDINQIISFLETNYGVEVMAKFKPLVTVKY